MVVPEGKQQQQLWKRGITEMNMKIKFPWNKKKVLILHQVKLMEKRHT